MNEFNKFYTKLNFEYISSEFELQLKKKKKICIYNSFIY